MSLFFCFNLQSVDRFLERASELQAGDNVFSTLSMMYPYCGNVNTPFLVHTANSSQTRRLDSVVIVFVGRKKGVKCSTVLSHRK